MIIEAHEQAVYARDPERGPGLGQPAPPAQTPGFPGLVAPAHQDTLAALRATLRPAQFNHAALAEMGYKMPDMWTAWECPWLGDWPRRDMGGLVRVYLLRRAMFANSFPICNWVWAMSYQEAIGYRFGVRAAWTTPDTMRDHVVLHSHDESIWTPEDLPAKQKGRVIVLDDVRQRKEWEKIEEKLAA